MKIRVIVSVAVVFLVAIGFQLLVKKTSSKPEVSKELSFPPLEI
jgi:hypothetical protein